ncbi:MAG: hypothetical protein E7586_02525 [Ruminococcaceae bacterium]|nr:hypothetical protein [Oscillospiraceae bacterium]
MKKEIKKCIKYYLRNIDSEAFREYVKKSEENGTRVHQEYIKEKKPQWANRTDYFEESTIARIIIGDVLSNDGVVKLLKKLYALPKNKFKVKNYYKKPPLKNKYDYIRLQYTHSGIGRFAEIEFLDDKYIKRIEISWSQINNYFAFIEYSFWFHKCLDETLYGNFISENLPKLTKKDYITWYHIKNDKEDKYKDNYMALQQMHTEFFNVVCQHYITTLLYSEQGSTNLLLNITFFVREKPIDISTLYISDFGEAFYNRKGNYIIVSDFHGDRHCLYSGNNRIPNFNPCGYISKYGNDFYYKFFGEKELKNFEYEFSKYTNGRTKAKYNKKIIRLLNKIQSLSDYEYPNSSKFYSGFKESWDFYVGNETEDIKKWHGNNLKKIKNIFEKNFEYLKVLTEINYTRSNHSISIIAAVISVVATIISLVAIFV